MGEGRHRLTTEAPPCAGLQKLLPPGLQTAKGVLRGRKCPAGCVLNGLGRLSLMRGLASSRHLGYWELETGSYGLLGLRT